MSGRSQEERGNIEASRGGKGRSFTGFGGFRGVFNR